MCYHMLSFFFFLSSVVLFPLPLPFPSPSLSLFIFLVLFLCSLLSLFLLVTLSFSFSLSLSLSRRLSLLSATMTMITRPVGSLCVHTVLTCLECQSACAFGPLPVCRTCSYHARNNCPSITVQSLCHLEWSGHVSVLEMGDVFVFGCVWLCLVELVCVVLVLLLVASVLASMRWLLCFGDQKKRRL